VFCQVELDETIPRSTAIARPMLAVAEPLPSVISLVATVAP